ncbi:MAG: terminase family protein [Chloroflexota bacterium]
MPPRCLACDHPQREVIEALEGTRSQSQLARDFGVDRQSIGRHFRNHVARDRASARRPLGAAPAAPLVAPPSMFVPSDPADTFRSAFKEEPMAHQVALMREERDTLVLKGRQIGMTTAAAALALHTALSAPAIDAVIVSPTMKQSTEVTGRARLGAWSLGVKLLQDSTSILRFENGSRVVSLPGKARSVRGYSAALLVIDEAAFVDDETWEAARPLTLATRGRTIVQSTGGWPVGWFYELFSGDDDSWARMRVRSDEAPNVDPAFLERERRAKADKPSVYAMEYEACFGDRAAGMARWFPAEEFDKRVDDRFQPIRIPPLGG